MHYAVAAETVDEVQAFDIRRRTDDRMMIGSHFVESGPGAAGIYFSFRQHRNARGSVRQNLFDESVIKFSFEARRFLRIIPGEQDSLPLATKMKAGRHVDDHRKFLW